MNDCSVKIIGLTGPTGSGKTMVADIFKENGYVIIDADKLARQAVEIEEVKSEIMHTFGEDLYVEGKLNRRELAKRAFSCKENELKLNSITHKVIIELTREKIEEYIKSGRKKIMYDAPLLFEAGAEKLCTCIISVIANVDVRVERIKKRDGLTDDEAQARVRVQHNDEFYISRSNYVIYNNFAPEDLKIRTLKILTEV